MALRTAWRSLSNKRRAVTVAVLLCGLKKPGLSRLGHQATELRAPFHRSAPLWSDKLITAEEMFGRKALRDYLQKLEREYEESLQTVNSIGSGGEQQQEELRAMRMRINLAAPLVKSICELKTKEEEMKDAESLLHDEDPDMRELAAIDIQDGLQHIQFLRHKIMEMLVPDDEVDLSELVLEVTAGVGGQESMLFTAEVFDMYQGFAQHQGWTFDRIPKTERQGRTHTSTMTVAVLPQPTQIGTKGRSEKIRTYNFPQDRITDHRIGLTVHDVRNFMLGEGLMEEMNSALEVFSNQEALLELLGEKLE
ncbi:hypothetical protein CRUP_024581 [Coryphaenoides rupestris]|nr:hypothetical protein CRUP_024581 [Coryphaenoides rupestris]